MANAEAQQDGRFARRSVRLSDAMPELLDAVPDEDRPLAERVLVAQLLEVTNDDFADVLETVAPEAFDFLVVGGLILKETALETRSALELLSRGDVLAPPLTALRQVESRAVSRYIAHGTASVAVLDGRFRQAAQRWPELTDVLHDQLGRQTHRASMHLAMLHLPRVDDRIVALFTDLSERFGRMTADGMVVDVPLTHELIGRLVGSRRPTVSLALQSLHSAGVLGGPTTGRGGCAYRRAVFTRPAGPDRARRLRRDARRRARTPRASRRRGPEGSMSPSPRRPSVWSGSAPQATTRSVSSVSSAAPSTITPAAASCWR